MNLKSLQLFLFLPNFVAEQFPDIPDEYVPADETVRGFDEILKGRNNDVPERAFLMTGTIEGALKKA